MGGKSKQTSRTTIDPAVMARATTNFDRALNIANQPYQPYAGVLDLSAPKQAAQGLIGFNAPKVTAQGFDAALANQTQIAPTVQAGETAIDRGAIRNIDGGLLSDIDLTAYLNPHTREVIDAFTADNERARQISLLADADKARAAGAFGGSRHGVAESLTNEAAIRSRDATTAGLRSEGFQTALSAAQSDLARRLQAESANQSADLSVAGQNASMAQQRELFNTEAKNARNLTQAQMDQAIELANSGRIQEARQFLASAQNSASHANQSAAISSAGVRAGAAGLLGDLNTREFEVGRDEYRREQDRPLVMQGLLNSTLGTIPVPQTTTSTTKGGGGLGGLLGGAGSLLSGFGALGLSDERTKTDIETAGYDDEGRRWVTYRHKGEPKETRRLGLLAQELAETEPERVARLPGGLLAVDYGGLI